MFLSKFSAAAGFTLAILSSEAVAQDCGEPVSMTCEEIHMAEIGRCLKDKNKTPDESTTLGQCFAKALVGYRGCLSAPLKPPPAHGHARACHIS
jgi:hypothetical protein